MNRVWLAALGGLLAGGGLGYGLSHVEAERRAQKKYRELNERQYKAMQMANVLRREWTDVEAPVESEEDLADTSENAIKVGGEMIVETPVATPDYIAAATQYANPEQFLPEMDYGISYIQAEEYEEDDGRPKEQITIFINDGEPIFMQDGQPIDDWAEKVGDSIMVDFYTMVPPGEDRVLFVRNARRDEDYEVIQEMP